MEKNSPNDLQNVSFDWEGARRRIAANEAALLRIVEGTPERWEHIWAQRAAQLARASVEKDNGELAALLVFSLGQETYGIDVEHVTGIRPAGPITPVPRVPEWVVGVVSVRGRVLSIIDPMRFFGLGNVGQARNGSQGPHVVIVEASGMRVGLLVDGVKAVETLPAGRVQSSPNTLRGIPPRYLRGVVDLEEGDPSAGGRGLLVVLSVAGLLGDETLTIQEEIT